MKRFESDSTGVGTSIAILVIVILLIFGVTVLINTSKWNNGRCFCGGEWVYDQAIGHNSWTGYLYHCNKCGKVIELYNKK